MKQFFFKVLIFTFPYLFVGCILFSPLWLTGELISLQNVVRRQQSHSNIIYGPAYTNPNPMYKMLATKKNKPRILVLGTSRVLQFRTCFFTRALHRFYNAGRGIRSLGEVLDFLEALSPDSLPQVLILGLDQYFFNYRWDSLSSHKSKIRENKNISPWRALNRYQDILRDYRNGKFRLRDLFARKDILFHEYKTIGLRAKISAQGFRSDGSYLNGRFLLNPEKGADHDFAVTLQRIRRGNRRFEYGQEVNPCALKEMKKILIYCREHNIHVVGFLPPFAHKVYSAMLEKGQYEYIRQLPQALLPLFQQYGDVFADYSDLAGIGASDDETIGDDAGFHGSEVAALRIVIKLAEKDPVLKEYTNIAELKKKLAHRKSSRIVE